MDWLNKTWLNEDKEFAPKRKVNNKKSKFMPHNSGYLYSQKMKRHIGYESLWGECLFYYFLELDPLTVRYYEQPVEIPVSFFNENNQLDCWDHVPDVLVFRQGFQPHLFQIKVEGYQPNKKDAAIEKICKIYARKRNWQYSLIKPREAIPKNVDSNVVFLLNFLKPRRHYERWIPEVLNKMAYIQKAKVIELAKGFAAKVDFRYILPVIYHLIARGSLNTDLYQPINEKSEVRLGNLVKDMFVLFERNDDLHETMYIESKR